MPVSCGQIKGKAILVPDNWSPSLEQARVFVDEIANNPALVNQQFLSKTSQNLADLSDAQLFIVYVRLIQSLRDKERDVLFNDQQQWLKKREETARAAVISKGGSLAPLEYSFAFRKMTEARLSELKKELNQVITIDYKEEKKP